MKKALIPVTFCALSITCLTVVILLGCAITPQIREWVNETETSHIASDMYDYEIAEQVNKAIADGWVVTEIGQDSCGNIYVYLER
jgi:hypothetical protein